MFSEDEAGYQGAVDSLDVIYKDGVAYVNIHTVDIINATVADMIDAALTMEDQGVDSGITDEIIAGAVFVCEIWRDLHDELNVRAETNELPDTVPPDLLDS